METPDHDMARLYDELGGEDHVMSDLDYGEDMRIGHEGCRMLLSRRRHKVWRLALKVIQSGTGRRMCKCSKRCRRQRGPFVFMYPRRTARSSQALPIYTYDVFPQPETLT